MLSVSQLVAAIKSCTKQKDLETGKALHENALVGRLDTNKYVATALIRMYSKCREMELAKQVFDGMIHHGVVSWNCLISGYVENDESQTAVNLYSNMNCTPDPITFVAVLKACACLARENESEKQLWLQKGIWIHNQIRAAGYESDMILVNTLVDMYGKCGSIDCARELFDKLPQRDVVTWNCLILGYVENGRYMLALEALAEADCEPDSFTVVAALKACRCLASESKQQQQACLKQVLKIHETIKVRGFGSDIVVLNALVDAYCKCGSIDRAKNVFDSMQQRNPATWTTLILGYIENGESSAAVDLFRALDCEPDCITFIAMLKACNCLAASDESRKQLCLEKGTAVHNQIKARGSQSNTAVANSLVDMYSKCGSMQQAREVFDSMLQRNVISWTSLILVYVANDEPFEALSLFNIMDCEPNHLTYVAALKACGSLAALPAGMKIHSRICRCGAEADQLVTNALIDFYGKCVSMCRAEELLDKMPSPDTVSWNSLIGGYSSIGDSARVFDLVRRMREAQAPMDAITFIFILNICSHRGLIEEGLRCLELMRASGVRPGVEHYSCMVDMLGRANRLQEALSLIRSMPVEADAVIWMSLLGSSRKWKNLEAGKLAFDSLVAIGTRESSGYVLMSDIYGSLSLKDQKPVNSRVGGVTSKEKHWSL